MTRDLEAEIRTYLADNGEASGREIAQGIQARAADVIDVLRGAAFSGPWLRGAGRERRKVYTLNPSSTRSGERVPARPTQNSRILELLADGQWHTTAEILRHVPCIVHSRIAELNGRGYRIEHRGSGGGAENHSYRLVALEEAKALTPALVSSSGTASTDARTPSVDGMAVPLVQLTLEEVAA